MDTCELYIEIPPLDIDYPCHTGEYQYRWDVPDPSIDGEGDIEGYHLYRCPKAELIERGRPVCNVDELVRKVISGQFDREVISSDIDSELNSILHKRLSIDFTMGGMLKALRRQGVQHLGYRSMGDFSVEHLSFSGRLASEMMRNFDVLSKLPLTKRAYLQCEIMKSALRHTSRVMTPENEAEWLSKAQALPLNELIDEVRKELEKRKSCDVDSETEDMEVEAIGADSSFSENGSMSPVDITGAGFPSEESDEQGSGVMMHFNVKPKLALVWDFALSHFRDSEQYGGSISEFIDALLGNYLSSAGRKRESCKSEYQESTMGRARGHRNKKGKGGKCESHNCEPGDCTNGDFSAAEQKTEAPKDREKILEQYAAMYLASRDSKKSEQENGALKIGPGTIRQPEDPAAVRQPGYSTAIGQAVDPAAIRQPGDPAAVRQQADSDAIGSKIGLNSIRLQSCPGPDLFSAAQAAPLPIFYSCHMRPNIEEKFNHLGDIEPPKRDEEGVCENGSNRENILIVFPPSFREIPDKVRETAERLVEYALMRQALDVGMGRLLWAMRYRSLYRHFECRSIEEYAIRYCDLSKPLFYRLLKLADGMEKRKNIKDAFESGLISRQQAGLILKIVNSRNEKAWIDYAAHVPTATLKEEVERIVRILQYDCLASGYYMILPGFRYITDERFHELPEDLKEIIRTGAWYDGPAIGSSWPLEEDDEQDVMGRDKRLEEPWNYFEDVDEMLIYEAEAKERKKKRLLCAREKGLKMSGRDEADSLCASAGGQVTSGRDGASPLCANGSKQNILNPGEVPALCADSKTSDCRCESHGDCQCNCGSNRRPGHSEDALSKAREIVKMPQGSDPAETLLLDILADDDSDVNADNEEENWPRRKSATMPIRFFLPEEMLEIWNFTALLYLERISAQNRSHGLGLGGQTPFFEENGVSPLSYGADPLSYGPQGFLAALLREYLLTERIHLKLARNYAILKRDRFRCQVPGCRCRRNLEVHHIIWRSKGGCDDDWNKITLCKAHHSYILHDLMALRIEGTAPDNLTFTFDPHAENGEGPLLVYHRGRKVKVR